MLEAQKKNRKRLADDMYKNLGVKIYPEPSENIYRFAAYGKPANNRACWLHYPLAETHASYGSHITSERFTWRAAPTSAQSSNTSRLTQEQVSHERSASREQRQQAQELVAQEATITIDSAAVADSSHPYLCTKRVLPHNLRQRGMELLVPMYNASDEIRNIQRIYPDCSKYFLAGGQVKGLYAMLGQPLTTGTVYVCEGWATAATIHEETGHPAVAAMNAGNLQVVCLELRKRAPSSEEIILAADNDHRTQGNPGLKKGTEAALSISAKITMPPVPCKYESCSCTDFNDYAKCCYRGLDNV